MKLSRLLIIACTAMLAACGEYYGYDADTAESPYTPREGVHLVKSVKTTSTYDGREYSWEHNFSYDAKNRIREIESSIVYHEPIASAGVTRIYQCNRTSRTVYYYLGDAVDVVYSVSLKYPGYKAWDINMGGTDEGIFNSKGLLEKLSALDFEYSGMSLSAAYSDGGRRYELTRSRDNVTGFKIYDDYSGEVIVDRGGEYEFSYDKNKTNFDFSAYFGYWGVEEELVPNGAPLYAAYQLAAFGMLGTTSPYLPVGKPVTSENGNIQYGKWNFDIQGRPVLYTDTQGRKTEVTYFD